MSTAETFATREEAIAHAMIDAAEGDEVLVHEEHCATRDPEEACTCEPVLLTVRRGAA